MDYEIWINGECIYTEKLDNNSSLLYDYSINNYDSTMLLGETISSVIDAYKTMFVMCRGKFMYYHNRKYDFAILHTENERAAVVPGHLIADTENFVSILSYRVNDELDDLLNSENSIEEIVQLLTPAFDKYLKSFDLTVKGMSDSLVIGSRTKSAAI